VSAVHRVYKGHDTDMRQPRKETSEKLREMKMSSFDNLRSELEIDVSKATLSRIARGVGPVSLAAENEVRAALGLAPIIPATAPAPVCQRCGIVHAVGDCHGIEGEPVILPPWARVVNHHPRKPTPPEVQRMAAAIESLQPEPVPQFKFSRPWWRKRMKR